MCQVIFMATITTSDELRLYNRTRILSCLRRNGKQSRTLLGESTGLSAATVTQITADLIDDGVIEQVTPVPDLTSGTIVNTRRGRPQVMLQLNPEAAITAVLTLLLNEIETTLYDYSGVCIYRLRKSLVTSSMSLSRLNKHLYSALDAALESVDGLSSPLKHIACVCQGTVTRDNSGMLWSPITKLRDVELRSILQGRYGVSVTVSNDCNTIAHALYYERQAWSVADEKPIAKGLTEASENNFAVILSSYGIGLGYFHHGDILTGSYSSGTEFGHMLFRAGGALCRCGRRGCIEAYTADYAIWRRAKGQSMDASPVDSIPRDELACLIEIAKRRPGPEREAFEIAGAAFGQGLANLFAIFDPFPALLVGISSDAFELMKPALIRNLQHYGMADSGDYVSVYDRTSERKLIRVGASLQSLSYLDKEIFGFGESTESTTPVAS